MSNEYPYIGSYSLLFEQCHISHSIPIRSASALTRNDRIGTPDKFIGAIGFVGALCIVLALLYHLISRRTTGNKDAGKEDTGNEDTGNSQEATVEETRESSTPTLTLTPAPAPAPAGAPTPAPPEIVDPVVIYINMGASYVLSGRRDQVLRTEPIPQGRSIETFTTSSFGKKNFNHLFNDSKEEIYNKAIENLQTVRSEETISTFLQRTPTLNNMFNSTYGIPESRLVYKENATTLLRKHYSNSTRISRNQGIFFLFKYGDELKTYDINDDESFKELLQLIGYRKKSLQSSILNTDKIIDIIKEFPETCKNFKIVDDSDSNSFKTESGEEITLTAIETDNLIQTVNRVGGRRKRRTTLRKHKSRNFTNKQKR